MEDKPKQLTNKAYWDKTMARFLQTNTYGDFFSEVVKQFLSFEPEKTH